MDQETELEELRGAIESWRQCAGLKHRLGKSMLFMVEIVVVSKLQRYVPNPANGAPELAASLMTTMMDLLGIDLASHENVHISVGDLDDEQEQRMDVFGTLADMKDPSPEQQERLVALREETAAYVLTIPRVLYDKAVERNTLAWVYSVAADKMKKPEPP